MEGYDNMSPKKLLLIFNPRAGRSKSRAPLFDALATFSAHGYLVNIHQTTAPGDATRTAAQEGPDYDLVVAAGGDGTLNEVICGLVQLENPPLLGYLPQGSTNDFAASLKISDDPAKAAEHLMTKATPQKLDIGRWCDRHFVYVASFGAFVRSSYSAPQAAKNALGHFAYILEGMKDLNSLRPYRIKLTADGEVLDGDYLFGAVCNSTSIGGLMKLDPERVVLNDGKFELLLIPNPRSPLALQKLVLSLLDQKYEREGVIFRHVSSIHLETAQPLSWSLDGECASSRSVVDIENLYQAVRILL